MHTFNPTRSCPTALYFRTWKGLPVLSFHEMNLNITRPDFSGFFIVVFNQLMLRSRHNDFFYLFQVGEGKKFQKTYFTYNFLWGSIRITHLCVSLTESLHAYISCENTSANVLKKKK